MHMFTAGVILCIPATMSPFSYLAHNAKAGVVRIIQMLKRLSNNTPVALQSHTILEELMKVAIKRELDMMLQPTEHQQSLNNYEEGLRSDSRNVFTTCVSTRVSSPSGDILSGTMDSHDSQIYTSQTLPDRQRPSGEARLTLGALGENNSPPECDTDSPGMASCPAPGLTNTNSAPLSLPIHEGSASVFSHDGIDYGQSYDLGAEPDDGFNSAFGALEKGQFNMICSLSTHAYLNSYVRFCAFGVARPYLDATSRKQ